MPPIITVLMPVYNGASYLETAIESILTQTYRDFTFFIIDDGSTDKSHDIISRYAEVDARIQYFRQPNIGLIATLNKYFAKADTKYIARMDCDDISLPQRLARQVNFLEENPHIGILGSAVKHMNETLAEVIEEANFPDTHGKILWRMLYTSGFSHPATMFRKDVFDKIGKYAESAKHVEDYDLFLRAKDLTQLANLKETLLIYRNHSGSVSSVNHAIQMEKHFLLSKKYFQSLNLPFIEDDAIFFMKHHRLSQRNDAAKIYLFLKIAYKKFIEKYSPTPAEKKYIYKDLCRHLSILAITYMNISFWKGIYMYLLTIIHAPWLIIYNLKNR